jgi:hypothetical protein
VLDHRLRATENADRVIQRLDNDLPLDFVSEGKRELDRPNMLAPGLAVGVVWA